MPLIADRYEMFERIGGGGMADVFRAHDRTLDRDVALKMMRPAFAGDNEFAERFHREAEALGAIDHPNIVRVLDYGASDEGPFIAMELVSGGTLRDLMRARGRVDQYLAAAIGAGIADGLEAAHLRGVLHRDLKPENVLLDLEGRPKIADFGIARLAAATAITRAGELLGTPQYLAPEQMSGDVVDERADVYALGVILHEMLTGQEPTGGKRPSEIVSRRLRAEPRPPGRLVPLAPAMNALVLRALARDPSRRFRRAADLRQALLEVRPPAPPNPSARRALRLPSAAPLLAAMAVPFHLLGRGAREARRAADIRVSAPTMRLAAPRLPTVVLPSLSLAPLRSAAARVHIPVAPSPARRRSVALLMLFALFATLVGGTFAFADRPSGIPAVAVASAAPSTAVLARTATPAPSASSEPSPLATVEPAAEPTEAPTPTPVVAQTSGDPAGTIVTFYQFISGHDYASASGLWSDRMRAAYPPQTNIWGRFDRTSSIVARSASITTVNPGSAAVAVDLIETMSDGTTRHWVGSWYLVRSGPRWLLDQPGLRPA